MLPIKVKKALKEDGTPRIYGAPPGAEKEVSGLPFWRTQETMMGIRYSVVCSAWKPSPDELAWLERGGVIILEIHGREPIPPVALNVSHKDLDPMLEEIDVAERISRQNADNIHG